MRARALWLLAVGILLAVPILIWLVSGWILDARVERLSAALDGDLAKYSTATFARPPLTGDPIPGTAREYLLAALAAAPDRTDVWLEDSGAFKTTGELNGAMRSQVDQAQDALDLVEQAARTANAGRWFDCGPAGAEIPVECYRVDELTLLASMDATRLALAGHHARAVDRCLAAIRLGRDQSRYAFTILGVPATKTPLDTLVRLRIRLPPAEVARALRFLELERSIPHPVTAERMGYLTVECSFRDALCGDEEKIACWGQIHTLDESGGFTWTSYPSGWRGFLDRRARRSRVRQWIPEAWELLRAELGARLSGNAPAARFEEKCAGSENPAIRYLGIGQRQIREAREEGERDLVEAIRALRTGPAREEKDEFRKTTAAIREQLVAALPEDWSADGLSRREHPSGRRVSGSHPFVYRIGLRYLHAPPPGPREDPDQTWIVISPKGFRWRSEDTAPFSPLAEQDWYDRFFGSSEVADFFIGYPIETQHYPNLTGKLVADALGVHGRHSPLRLLQFELEQHLYGEPLFKRIRERSVKDRLQFAAWTLDELRNADALKFTHVFPVLPGVLFQPLDHARLWGMTDEPGAEERQVVLKLWRSWCEWAKDKSEEEWMRNALDRAVALVAHENLWIAEDAVGFLEQRTGQDFGDVRLVPEESRQAVIENWNSWHRKNAGKLRWDPIRERFVLP